MSPGEETGSGSSGSRGSVVLRVAFHAGDVPRLRVLVEGQARLAGLPVRRRGDFVLAMDAVAANAVQHGGGKGVLTLVRHPDALECTIADRGPGFTEDVIPELAPGVNDRRFGRGLWLTRLVTDRLTIVPGTVAGTTVSFTMRLD